MAYSNFPGKILLELEMKSSRIGAFFNQKISVSNGWKFTFFEFSWYFLGSNRCFYFILMYLSFVLIWEKLYLTTKWRLLYLFLKVLCCKKVQKSLISCLKYWHFWCLFKVRFIHSTFKNSVEFTKKTFFQSDNSHTNAHCFYVFVTKKSGECDSNSVQGCSRGVNLANVLMYLSFRKTSNGLVRFSHGYPSTF